MAPRIVRGDDFGKQLCEALGIDMNKGFVKRIVIDVRPAEAVRVFVEMLGSEKLLDVDLPTSEVEIVTYASQADGVGNDDQ